MKFKTRKEALATITMRERTVNGTVYPIYCAYLGTNLVTKKCERLYASTKQRLERLIDEFYEEREKSGDFASSLSAEQIVDARAAIHALQEAKLGISLAECARREIERSGCSTVYDKTVGEAYDDFIDSKSLNSELELQKTESTTGKWVGCVGRDRILSSVTIEEIASYVRTNYGNSAPRTYNSHISYIKTFLSWCANPEQKFIPTNPALPIKMKPVAWKRPEYMKPDDVRKLFDLLWEEREHHPEYLALAVTQFFIGVRREEALRMAKDPDTATIIIEDETFRVDGGKGHTKGIAPRAAHLQPNAVAWMKSFDYMAGIQSVTDGTTGEYYSLARSRGIPIFKNCARHTFITMHVAKFHTPEVTQAMVGTSGTMRAAHYDGLAPQREGEAYFDIFPPKAENKAVPAATGRRREEDQGMRREAELASEAASYETKLREFEEREALDDWIDKLAEEQREEENHGTFGFSLSATIDREMDKTSRPATDPELLWTEGASRANPPASGS